MFRFPDAPLPATAEEALQYIASPWVIYDADTHRHRYSHPKWNLTPQCWRATMGAVYAQFVTPFEISDAGLHGYRSTAYFRLARDKKYVAPHADRPSRGWVVVRARNGMELFRADVNMFMDGGVGINTEDYPALTDSLVDFAARHSGAKLHGPALDERYAEDVSTLVVENVLRQLEGMNSPWACVKFPTSMAGIEVFHETPAGARTTDKYVVDLRLDRVERSY